jgi:large subunit ribosomal protein L10
MVDEIVDRINKHPNFIITTYMGSSVADIEGLRKSLKKSSGSYMVVKNSILKVVFDKLKLEGENSKIESGMGISLSGDDIISTCKTVATFASTHEKFKIKGAVIDGKSVPVEKVKALATLPPKEVLLAQALRTMKSPITGLVYTLSGVLKKIVYAVVAIKSAKQGSEAAAPAQAAPAQAEAAPAAPEAKA